ncbi:hypothetical protein [Mucilaginibacter arboris]|nr:hypothetical protein [Mucilaginibacter arboris]
MLDFFHATKIKVFAEKSMVKTASALNVKPETSEGGAMCLHLPNQFQT